MGLREDFLDIFSRDEAGAAPRKKVETTPTGDARYRAGFAKIYEILTGNDNKSGQGRDNPPDPNRGMK